MKLAGRGHDVSWSNTVGNPNQYGDGVAATCTERPEAYALARHPTVPNQRRLSANCSKNPTTARKATLEHRATNTKAATEVVEGVVGSERGRPGDLSGRIDCVDGTSPSEARPDPFTCHCRPQ